MENTPDDQPKAAEDQAGEGAGGAEGGAVESTERGSPSTQQHPAHSQNQPQFDILRIYSKDTSLETPGTPAIFQHEWKPELKVEFDSTPNKLDEGQYEVTLRITVTCTSGSDTAFICEVNQSGIFLIRNLPDETVEYLLGASIPNILFPYARENISNLVSRATFPQLNLAPINFDAIFRSKKAKEAQQGGQPNS